MARGESYLAASIRVFAVAGMALAAFMLSAPAAVAAGTPDRSSGQDGLRTSLNIHQSGLLTPTQDHPYLGFWKVDCSHEFGLAIMAAGPGRYSVTFCGPGGCFEPGTYRPDTTLVSDESYIVESPSRLQVKRQSGSYSTYQRCWPR